MNIAVRYYTKSGNTKKLADAIGDAVGVKAEDVSTPLTEKTDILFLGSSVYAGGVDEAVKTFLSKNAQEIECIVNFSTAAVLSSTYKQISKLAASNGIKIADEEFHCRGSFGIMHKNHPDAKDLKNAANFAKKIYKKQSVGSK